MAVAMSSGTRPPSRALRSLTVADAGMTAEVGAAQLATAVRAALEGLAASMDDGAVAAAEAAVVVKEMARVVNLASAVGAHAAGVVAASDRWRQQGHRSAAHWLAQQQGGSGGAARAARETLAALPGLPVLSQELRRGRLSSQQAALIADAAADAPNEERRLVELALEASLGELREECLRVKAAADPDPDGSHQRIRRARRASRRNLADGSAEIRYQSTRDQVAQIWAVMRGYARNLFDQARIAGVEEPAAAYLADALLTMAEVAGAAAEDGADVQAPAEASGAAGNSGRQPGGDSPSGDPPGGDPPAGTDPAGGRRRRVRKALPVKLIVRIDHQALVRGRVGDGEVCEVAGVGPVPVSVVEELLQSGDPFLAAVVTNGHDVASVVHLGRKPTAHQRTVLEWLGVECARRGCTQTEHLQIDHREEWAATRVTRIQALDWLCTHDHNLKTRHGWALVEGSGKREMVPPEDPRHPGSRDKLRSGPAP